MMIERLESMMNPQRFGQDRAALSASLVAAGSAAALAGAWLFQYVIGLAPCPLCLQQRWPYYVAIPFAIMVAIAARRGMSRALLAGLLGVLALVLLAGAALGLYHAGIEWAWWAGPQDCSGGAAATSGDAGSLMRRMQTATVVRCDQAAWRDGVIGLSLAGWNMLVALGLAGVAMYGATCSARDMPATREPLRPV